MHLSQIQTRTEKVLFAVAVSWSAIVWLGIAAAFIYPFTGAVPPVDPCVTSEEYDGDVEYYHYPMSDAIASDYVEDCLPRKDVPEATYQEAVDELRAKAKSDKYGPALALGIVFLYIGIFLGFLYVSTALAMAFIRLNGVKLTEKQYPAFYKIYKETAQELGLKQIPDAYIIHASGDINAFAIKIARKKMVVFFSELIEALVEGDKLDQLHAVAAHELTHVKLRHINYWLFLLPFTMIPFVGSLFGRVRELSADRGALFICKKTEPVTQALVKLATGKMVAKEVNVHEYVKNSNDEYGIFIALAKIIGSHPPIPQRIDLLQKAHLHESFHKHMS